MRIAKKESKINHESAMMIDKLTAHDSFLLGPLSALVW